MTFLSRFTLRARLLFLVGFATLLMLIIGALGLGAMHAGQASLQAAYQQHLVPTGQLNTIIDRMQQIRSMLVFGLQHEPGSKTEQWHKHDIGLHTRSVEKNIGLIDETWGAYLSNLLSEEERALAEAFEQKYQRFIDEGVKPVAAALLAGDYLEAIRVLLEKTNPAFMQAHKAADKILQYHLTTARTAYEEELALGRLVQSVSIGLILASVGLLSLLAYFTIRGVGDGVNRLSTASTQLAAGDLTARCDYDGKDELGQIAKAFNDMGGQFQAVITELVEATSQLAAAAEKTSVITDETSTRIGLQVSEAEQVATAMNEMTATVQDVAHTATTAATATSEADARADEGREVAAQALAATEDLASEVQQATQVIRNLEKESETIGSVLDVIRGIAEQTNLLALNAAIEAARAGEQGRGFAVVADEVRTLAGRTQDSTQEIQRMIEVLQQSARAAAQAMDKGQSKAQHSLEQVTRADEALEKINTAVALVRDMNAQIATAAEEQGAVAEEINRSIVSIRDLSSASAKGAEQTAVASTQQAHLAANLQTTATRFTI